MLKYQLKKVVEDWNVTPGDGHLYYTFRPPWVTSRITDTFFALHPEQRAFQDSASKAAARASRGTGSTGRPLGNSSSIGGAAAATGGSVAASAVSMGASGEVIRPDMA